MSSQFDIGSSVPTATMNTPSTTPKPTQIITPTTFAIQISASSTLLPSGTAVPTNTACPQWAHVKCHGYYTHLVWVIAFGTLLYIIFVAVVGGYLAGKTRAKKKHRRVREALEEEGTEITSNPGMQYASVSQSMSSGMSSGFEGIPRRNSMGSIADIGTLPAILRVVNPDPDSGDSLSIELIDDVEGQDEEKKQLEDDIHHLCEEFLDFGFGNIGCETIPEALAVFIFLERRLQKEKSWWPQFFL